MKERHDTRSRGEIESTTERLGERLQKEEDDMEMAADDKGVAFETRGALDLSITDEGAAAVTESLEDAGNEATREFREREREFDETVDEGDHWIDELAERERSGESDLDHATDAHARVRLTEVANRMERSLDSLREDIALFRDEAEKNRIQLEEKERNRQDLRARIDHGDD